MGDPNGPCRCPDCDPVVAAGYIACGGCHGRAYALDATWITLGRFIMASFGPVDGDPGCAGGDPGCAGGHRARLVLVDVDAEDATIPRIQPRICKGTVRTGPRRGQPCIRPAAHGSTYCRQHDPDRRTAGRAS